MVFPSIGIHPDSLVRPESFTTAGALWGGTQAIRSALIFSPPSNDSSLFSIEISFFWGLNVTPPLQRISFPAQQRPGPATGIGNVSGVYIAISVLSFIP